MKADVLEYDGNVHVKTGKALIKFDRKGAYVVKWIKKLDNNNKNAKQQNLAKNDQTPNIQWQRVRSAKIEDLTFEIPVAWTEYRDEDTWLIKTDDNEKEFVAFEVSLEKYDRAEIVQFKKELVEQCKKLQISNMDSHGHTVVSMSCLTDFTSGSLYSWQTSIFKTPSINKKKVAFMLQMSDTVDAGSIMNHVVQSVHFAGKGKKFPLHGYVARLSKKDHFDSHGGKLDSVAAILRQDRENFQKGKRDKEDDLRDSYLNTEKIDTEIETYKIVPINIPYDSLANVIINQTPLVWVEINPPNLYVQIME